MARTAGPNSQFGRRRRVRQSDCKNSTRTTFNCKQRVLAERSQIAQFFQWLPRSRQTREGKVRVAGLVLGPGLRLEAVMRRMLIVTAAGAAMLPRVSQAYEGSWCALTDIGGGVMHENCAIPNFRDVRAGGDCGHPRLLQSEPVLAGAAPGGPGDRSPAKARQLLTDAVAPPRTKALAPKSSPAGSLQAQMRRR